MAKSKSLAGLRVLHLPTTVGAGAHGLSLALASLGCMNTIWAFRQNYLDYPIDFKIFKDDGSVFRREIARLFAISYVFKADCFFFNFGSTLFTPPRPSEAARRSFPASLLHKLLRSYLYFMQLIELSLISLLRKPYFVVYQGDDIRQGSYLLKAYDVSLASVAPSGYYSCEDDSFKRRQLHRISSGAAQTYFLNPDLAPLLPPSSVFLPYCHVDIEQFSAYSSNSSSDVVRIVHAPTHRQIKGTDYILSALHQLESEGVPFQLDLVENKTHEQAIRRYCEADLLIDQLFAGWYGGVALECMAMGKAVACYIREEDLGVIPAEMAAELPVLQIDYLNICSQLREIILKGARYLRAAGLRSRDYAIRWHSHQAVSKILETSMAESGLLHY